MKVSSPMKTRQKEHRLELLVVQPTPFCNLDCDYCYLPHRNSTRRISEEVLRRCFERVLASRYVQGSFTVVWHAGEPLVLPVEFYEKAFRLIRKINVHKVRIGHSLQTNGTLIDSQWCAFLSENEVKIGVSVDGPAFLHDARRRTRTGKGTYQQVMRGIRCLQEHKIDFHVISVLTREALDHPDAMFQFYVENGIQRVGFNIEEIEGVNQVSSLTGDAAALRVRAFMTRFLDRVKGYGGRLDVREFQGLGQLITEGQGFLTGNQENTPMAILSVDCMGNLSTFSPELLGSKSERYEDFLLGNILHDDLDSIEATARFRRIRGDVEKGISRCRKTCGYFAICGGGSPSNKYFENGSLRSTETMHCRLSRKVIADVLLEDLENSLGLND